MPPPEKATTREISGKHADRIMAAVARLLMVPGVRDTGRLVATRAKEAYQRNDLDAFYAAGHDVLNCEEQKARAGARTGLKNWLGRELDGYIETHSGATVGEVIDWLTCGNYEDFIEGIEGTKPHRVIRYIPEEGHTGDSKSVSEKSLSRRIQRARKATVAG